VSQIGYMIMAAGLGAYVAAMFHFLTHAFFKALLFLAAGIVIHALAGEQSIDKMGGLVRHLHLAWFAMLVGVLAIIGVPGFSGFFSKDEILASAYETGGLGIVLWLAGTLAAALTAFYMLRLFIRVFHGPEPEGGYPSAPHPSGVTMAIPVAILTFLSLVGGWIQVPSGWHLMEDWLHPVLADAPETELSGAAETISVLGSLVAVLVGAGLAWWVFLADPGRRERLASRFPGPRSVLDRAWLFDEIYDTTVVAPTRELGDTLLRTGEPGVAQGIVTGGLATVGSAGRVLGRIQTGLVRSYVFVMVAGVVAVALIVLVVANPGAAESFLGVDLVGYLRGDG
jgi:NADH-quinone oxidoreductase subunit L